MKRHITMLLASMLLAACAPDKNPHSLAEMSADEALARSEKKACENGDYDGKRWKEDHCAQASIALQRIELKKQIRGAGMFSAKEADK